MVIVANLKPANMRGVKSQAIVLAASSPDGSKARRPGHDPAASALHHIKGSIDTARYVMCAILPTEQCALAC